MHRSVHTTLQPMSTAAIAHMRDRFSYHTPATQDFLMRHIEKQRARQRQRAKSPRDQDLDLRLQLAKLKHSGH